MADNDDFDEWLDDVETDDDGELDQLNIDALLSAVDDEGEETATGTSSELDQTNIDALLGINNDDSPPQDTAMDELDQDNIDALLGNQDDEPSQEVGDADDKTPIEDPEEASSLDDLDQDNIDALLSGDDDNLEELDQDNIDALLSGDDGLDELDQDNIDALLSGDASPADEEPEPVEAAEPGEDLDQSNIDDLLAAGDSPEEEVAAPDQDDNLEALLNEAPSQEEATDGDADDQDDIDALFNDIDAATAVDEDILGADSDDQSVDDLFAEDDIDDNTTLSAADADEAAESAFDSEFDEMDQLFSELEDDSGQEDDPFQAEEIDFAEMLDSSGNNEEDEFLELGDDDEDEFAMSSEVDDEGEETDIDALLAADEEASRRETEESTAGLAIPAFISGMSKATMSAIGGGLALFFLFALYFMFSGDSPEEMAAIPPQDTPEAQQAPAAQNFIPLAEDSTYAMDNTGTGLAIELKGADEDDQPLIFQVTSQPAHGRLSGTAPHFTYLANSDFPGEDSFEYTVNDGIDTSATALITITGPDLKGIALAQKIAEAEKKKNEPKKVFKPKKPVVLAKNVHFYTESTAPVTIDWRRIWKEANKSDYDPKIHVEIVKAETAGSWGSTKNSKTVFTPDPYSGRSDLLFYRFKKDGFRSATKTISIDIELGNPAPEINFAKLQQGYPVGQNVQLDASPSRDDSPENLKFSWEQVSGVPVSMNISTDNGCKMDFVMPSSFYNQKDSGPVFKVSATDKTGKTTSRQVKVKTISRRQAALWRGINGGVAEEPAMKGQYFPWPYDD